MYFRQFAYFRQLLLKNAQVWIGLWRRWRQEGWKIQFELQGTKIRFRSSWRTWQREKSKKEKKPSRKEHKHGDHDGDQDGTGFSFRMPKFSFDLDPVFKFWKLKGDKKLYLKRMTMTSWKKRSISCLNLKVCQFISHQLIMTWNLMRCQLVIISPYWTFVQFLGNLLGFFNFGARFLKNGKSHGPADCTVRSAQ